VYATAATEHQQVVSESQIHNHINEVESMSMAMNDNNNNNNTDTICTE